MGGTPGIMGGIPVDLKQVKRVSLSFYLKKTEMRRLFSVRVITLIASGVHPVRTSHRRDPELGHRRRVAGLGLDRRNLLCRRTGFVIVVVVLVRIVLIGLFLLTLWKRNSSPTLSR